MDDFSVLTGLLGYLDSTQEVELKSLHAQTYMVIFVTEFCNLGQKSSLYEVNQ